MCRVEDTHQRRHTASSGLGYFARPPTDYPTANPTPHTIGVAFKKCVLNSNTNYQKYTTMLYLCRGIVKQHLEKTEHCTRKIQFQNNMSHYNHRNKPIDCLDYMRPTTYSSEEYCCDI
jgi:hypothetical protein